MTRTSQWRLTPGSARYVIPEKIVSQLARHPLSSALYPLAFGHYRRAAGHHMHREHHTDDLLIYCTEGRAYLSVEGEPLRVEAGDLLLLPPGASHRYAADSADPWTLYWVHYTGPLAPDFRRHMGFDDGVYLRHPGREPRLLVDFNGLLGVQQSGFGETGLIHASNRLRQLLSGIPLSVRGAERRGTLDLAAIHDYMREHLNERLTLADLAQMAGLSPAHFATRYRKLTGTAPIHHFLRLKVERACQLLDGTHLTLAQISAELGFADSYYFSRLFRRIMGRSPSDYRHTSRH